MDGVEFDTSLGKGAPLSVIINQHPLKGFREVLPLMQRDAKWEVYMPSNMVSACAVLWMPRLGNIEWLAGPFAHSGSTLHRRLVVALFGADTRSLFSAGLR